MAPSQVIYVSVVSELDGVNSSYSEPESTVSVEAEGRIVGGVIDSALEAVKAAGVATREAEKQIEAFATFVRFDPDTEDQALAPNITAKEMKAALAVAKRGSFTEAAKELGVSQPGLSRQVPRVEKLYGFDFFNRSVRSSPVTPSGRTVL